MQKLLEKVAQKVGDIIGKGRKQRRMVTFRQGQHTTKTAWCGHKVDTLALPKLNCEQCWTFFFITNADFTRKSMTTLVKEGGEKELTETFGSKFVKKLKKMALKIVDEQGKSDALIAEIEEGQKKKAQDMILDREYDVVDSEGNPVNPEFALCENTHPQEMEMEEAA